MFLCVWLYFVLFELLMCGKNTKLKTKTNNGSRLEVFFLLICANLGVALTFGLIYWLYLASISFSFGFIHIRTY